MIHSLRSYGEARYKDLSQRKYMNTYQGRNSRMDEIQAALLSAKLADLDHDTDIRRSIAKFYLEKLENPKLILPYVPECVEPAWHLFVVRASQRNALKAYLEEKGIRTLIHYPIPPHKQQAYAEWNQHSYPVTEKIHNEVLSIPLAPHLSHADQQLIVDTLNAY